MFEEVVTYQRLPLTGSFKVFFQDGKLIKTRHWQSHTEGRFWIILTPTWNVIKFPACRNQLLLNGVQFLILLLKNRNMSFLIRKIDVECRFYYITMKEICTFYIFIWTLFILLFSYHCLSVSYKNLLKSNINK